MASALQNEQLAKKPEPLFPKESHQSKSPDCEKTCRAGAASLREKEGSEQEHGVESQFHTKGGQVPKRKQGGGKEKAFLVEEGESTSGKENARTPRKPEKSRFHSKSGQTRNGKGGLKTTRLLIR